MPNMKRALSIGFKAILVTGIAIDAVQLFRELKGLHGISHKMHDDYTCGKCGGTCCACGHDASETAKPAATNHDTKPEPQTDVISDAPPFKEPTYTYPKNMIPTVAAAEAIRLIDEAKHTESPKEAIQDIITALRHHMEQEADTCTNENALRVINYAKHTNDPDGIILGAIQTLENYLADTFPGEPANT